MRGATLGVGILATVMAITVDSIYFLWYLCSDLVYVILFPQLVCVVYFRGTNTYGSLAGYFVGLFFRLSGGEDAISIPPLIEYPMYNAETKTQNFPFKTMSMLLNLITVVIVSYLLKYLFESGKIPRRYDFFNCIVKIPEENIALATKEPTSELTAITPVKEFKGNVNPALKLSREDIISDYGSLAEDFVQPSEEKAPIDFEKSTMLHPTRN